MEKTKKRTKLFTTYRLWAQSLQWTAVTEPNQGAILTGRPPTAAGGSGAGPRVHPTPHRCSGSTRRATSQTLARITCMGYHY